MTSRRGSDAAELPALKKVTPQLPPSDEEVEALREDLRRMGCAGLLSVPWGFQEETMVRELMDEPPAQFHGTVRAYPEKWSGRTWRAVYDFGTGGCGLTNRKDDFAREMFDGRVDAKEGYSVEDCRAKRA